MPLRDRSWSHTLFFTKLPSAYISGDNNPSRINSSFRPSKIAAKPSQPIRSMNRLMLELSNTGSPMVRKQNQRYSGFSDMAEHSRRKGATFYSEQISSALTITSGWMAGLPKSGQ